MKFSVLHICLILLILVSCKKPETIVLDISKEKLILNNGVLEFDEKPFTGILQNFFSNVQLQSEVVYIEGKKDGAEKQWFVNGALAIERFYEEGVKIGVHKAWWENGSHKFEYHFNDRGEFHGNVKEWYADGRLFRDFNYKKGREVGSQKLWKPDGSIKSNYEVINGERFGLIGLKKCYTVTVNSDEIK